MEQKNIFIKGHKADLDPSYMDNQSFRKAKNFRFIKRDGRGFVASPLNSNELEFEIKEGYVPLNGIEYKGIYYMVSYNPDTKNIEVGSFPSPGDDGFVTKYKAIQTLEKDKEDNDFDTNKLGITWDNTLDIIARENFDKTVNLYLCDYVNPNYVINTGFDQDGNYKEETIKDEELPERVYQFNAPQFYPKLENFNLVDGGTNKPGAYYIYIRYVDSSLTATVFINSFGPFMIGEKDAGLIDDMGNSRKGIKLKLEKLDVAYPYFQIGISRKSENDNVPVSDTYLVDVLYKTQEEKEITIYGSESNALLTNEELLLKNSSFVSCKSHTIHEGKYIGANWKSAKRDYDTFFEIAQSVDVEVKTEYQKSDHLYSDYIESEVESDDIAYDNIGYMRGEIYPFAMVFIFKDGSESQPVPIKGKKFNNNNTIDNINDKGLVMMPNFGDSDEVNNLNNLIFVKFDLTEARSVIQDSEEMKNVKSFYFVRGDRIKNRTYTGLAHAASFAVLGRSPDHDNYAGEILFLGKENSNNNNTIPTYYYNEDELSERLKILSNTSDFKEYKKKSLYVPYLSEKVKGFIKSNDNIIIDNVITHEELMSDKYYFFYSPDHLFSTENDIQNFYFKPLFEINLDEYRKQQDLPVDGEGNDSLDIQYGREIIDCKNDLKVINDGGYDVEIVNVNEGVGRDSYDFGTLLHHIHNRESEPLQGEPGWNMSTGFVIRTNANIKFRGFLGLKFNNPFNHKKGVIGSFVKYSTDVEYYATIKSSFSVKNTLYKKISDIFPIARLSGFLTIKKGDIFINKVFFRQARWIGNPTYWKDNNYAHGTLLGLVVESELNTFLRNEVPATDEEGTKIRYSFFPKILEEEKEFNDWMFFSRKDEDIYEAMQINRGYSHMLPDRALFGYDEALPENGIIRPTRLYFSGEQKINAFADAFSTINPGSYMDYPVEDGEVIYVDSINGNLFSANRLALVQYFSGQNKIESNPSTGSIVVGSNYQFLNPKSRKFADFGVQHHKAIVNTGEMIFGVDAYKKKLWTISLGYTNSGYAMLSAKDIAKEQLVYSKVLSLINDYLENETRYSEYIDSPSKNKGIVLGHDPEYNEVLFSFHNNEKDYSGKTYVFSLDLGAFNDEYTIVSPHYFNLNNKLLSVNPNDKHNVYLHNKKDQVLSFYDKNHISLVEVIVTGVNSESNLNSLEKEFFNCQIRSPETELESIIFRTETQKSVLSPFIENPSEMFFRNPEYYEGKWQLPIPLQSSSEKSYEEQSEMRGDYLSVTLKYNKNKSFFIKHVITNYEISY